MSERITWKVLPARNKKKLVIFLSTVIGFSILVLFVAGIYWALFSLLVLLGSLFQFYTYTEYTLDDEGVTIKRPLYTVKKPWSEFKRVVETQTGIFLSPFSFPSRLDSFRGVHLLIENEDREKILEFIKGKIHNDSEREDRETERTN